MYTWIVQGIVVRVFYEREETMLELQGVGATPSTDSLFGEWEEALQPSDERKQTGAYYTPESTVQSLVRWAVRSPSDRLLDPSCGDGRFLSFHGPSVGIEQDGVAAVEARRRAPSAVVHEQDFFRWASETTDRFECAAGNPPFIRYQRFSGESRAVALGLCKRMGVEFSGLASSWAPFLVAAAGRLKGGGRMAFVVPAEIGHAPYAVPLLKFLVDHFGAVQVVAVKDKIFPDLSEDCWLLFADGYGESCDFIKFSELEHFKFMGRPPLHGQTVGMVEWNSWNCRLRPFLLNSTTRALYRSVVDDAASRRFSDVAKVGIGYVTGDNEFFHLRPSTSAEFDIPKRFLYPTVRNGKFLTKLAITDSDVTSWRNRNEPAFLLRMRKIDTIPESVQRYLSTPQAKAASAGYKCRNRTPWFVVPDVTVPDAFLTYMSGKGPSLVLNRASCACTNSLLAVTVKDGFSLTDLQKRWRQSFTQLSCELEGHPLGGGMLKLEPREAGKVVLARFRVRSADFNDTVSQAIDTMRQWRHYG